MEISQQSIREFRDDFARAVRSLEVQYGVKIKLGAITYSPTEFHGKLSVTNEEDLGPMFDNYVRHRYPNLVGKLNRIVLLNGKRFRITGCQPNRRRYDIVVKDLNTGKDYVYTGSSVANAQFETNGGFSFDD